MRRLLMLFALLLAIVLVGCGGGDTVVVTATPVPVTDVPVPTLTPTLDPLNPHEGASPFTELVTNANLVGEPNVTGFDHEGTRVIVNYPRGFEPLCEPFNGVGTEYPCAWVDDPETVSGSYPFEANEIAGYFGFTLDPVVTLYPSDNYRYVARCDIRQGTPFFTSDSHGVVIRFLSDEFDGGVYTFPRSGVDRDSHVFTFEVAETMVVTYQCGMDIDWASFPRLNFTFTYMGLQIVAPDYGGDDYVVLGD